METHISGHATMTLDKRAAARKLSLRKALTKNSLREGGHHREGRRRSKQGGGAEERRWRVRTRLST